MREPESEEALKKTPRITVYNVAYMHGMWRVMMLDECFLAISNDDKESSIKLHSISKRPMTFARTEAEIARSMVEKKKIKIWKLPS